MADAPTYRSRLKEVPRYYLGGIYQQVNDKQVFLWAQAIAFKVLITIVPVSILGVTVLAYVLQWEKPFEAVAGFIMQFLPSYRSSDVIGALEQLQRSSGTLTVITLASLLFFAMTLFTTLRVVISNIFQEDWHETRSIIGGYAFDLRMAAQVGLLFILSLGLTLAVQAFNTASFEFIDRIGLDAVWVREGWRRTIRTLGLLIPFLISVVMFFQLFFFIPKPRPPKRSALLGATVTALLWDLAKFAFTLYATRLGRFERYRGEGSSDTAISGLGDTFGLILALVFWVYYSGIVLCIGGIVALLHEKRYRAHRRHLRAKKSRRRLRWPSRPKPNGHDVSEQHAPAEPAANETASSHVES